MAFAIDLHRCLTGAEQIAATVCHHFGGCTDHKAAILDVAVCFHRRRDLGCGIILSHDWLRGACGKRLHFFRTGNLRIHVGDGAFLRLVVSLFGFGERRFFGEHLEFIKSARPLLQEVGDFRHGVDFLSKEPCPRAVRHRPALRQSEGQCFCAKA